MPSAAPRAWARATGSRFVGAGIVGAGAILLAALVAGAIRRSPPPVAASAEVGQWIWSREDARRFADARRTLPRLLVGIRVATISTRAGAIEQGLGLSPSVAGAASVALVVRFDDSFSAVWDGRTDAAVAGLLGDRLRALLRAADASRVPAPEIQLDYDCPERLLPRWAAVVGRLARGPLVGRSVWVTSLVAHLRHAEYGALFRGQADGHILQVFDTGDRMSAERIESVRRLAERARLPFRLGVGAFERRLATGETEHRAWFVATEPLSRSKWYRGVWVFPAGREWRALYRATR